ncbi:MAG: ABC transporter permease [Anaerolineae bacterium]
MGDVAERTSHRARWLARLSQPLAMPLLALTTALALGAVIMLLSGDNPLAAYWGLLQGSFGGLGAISRTLRTATPFILTGLSVAFAFKAGLFNIGASGQYLMGTAASVAVGVTVNGLPVYIHLPLALCAGFIGGALWGAIPGALKVWRGAHEVITTIMLNYVASLFIGWLVYAGGTEGQQPGPLSDPVAATRGISQTGAVLPTAILPEFVPNVFTDVHWGLVIALIAAGVIWWVLRRSTFGFEVRTVGENLSAARYAGIRVNWTIVLTMAIAGGLAGLAGAVETLGLHHRYAPEFTGSSGFEGITVALLGNTHPVGVVLSSIFMGALYGGAAKMQFDSGVRGEIIQVVQALVLMLVAAPEIVRVLYRMRTRAPGEDVATTRPTVGLGG